MIPVSGWLVALCITLDGNLFSTLIAPVNMACPRIGLHVWGIRSDHRLCGHIWIVLKKRDSSGPDLGGSGTSDLARYSTDYKIPWSYRVVSTAVKSPK